MRAERLALLHGFAAFTLAGLVLAWGVLLSPPMEPLRSALGIELEGTRLVDGRFEVINLDYEAAKWFLARASHYYHVLFAILLYGTLAVLVWRYKPPRSGEVLWLAGLGAGLTTIGGLGYAYAARDPPLHGLFIAGLAVLFAAGAMALWSFKPRDPLGYAVSVCGVLLLIGGAIGGYVASNYMDKEAYEAFKSTFIEARLDPGVGEENELWRAWTGHAHAMIAVALSLVFAAALSLLELRTGLFTKLLLWSLIPTTTIMAVASYSVWFVGGVAHKAITPAAVLLTMATLLLSFMAKAGSPLEPRGILAWALRVGNIGVWAFVSIPGALVAISLKKPTAFFNPPLRDPAWDWVEVAFSIGHWHILLTAWGVTLAILAATMAGTRRAAISAMAVLAGFTLAGVGFVAYIFTADPGPYNLNPYTDPTIKFIVEPGLAILTLGLIGVYIEIARKALQTLRTEGEQPGAMLGSVSSETA